MGSYLLDSFQDFHDKYLYSMSSKADLTPTAPAPEARLALLGNLWRSRLGDLREQNLIRQGKGWFHI